MESWVLEGDSYSFLRSAPRNFNLRQREGPNRVEIFDITSIPSSHSEISETTCLCDIFGDDCESPSLSSSPASTSFLKREVDAHLTVEDVNDSSGSYHTAHSSEQLSDRSDSFEDSRDSLKQGTKESFLPKTGEFIPTPTDLNSLNNKTVDSYENHSPLPSLSTQIDDGNLSQTESQNEPSLAQNIDADSSAQCLASSTSEFRDTTSNCRIIDSSETSETPETITTDLYPPEPSYIKPIYTEQTKIPSSDTEDFSTPPIPHQLESPILDNQDHPVTYGPLDKFSQEIQDISQISEASAEEDNVITVPEENVSNISSPDIRSNCSSPIEDVPQVQEDGQSDCSAGLTNLPLDTLGNGDLTPVENCPSTPPSTSPSIRALTPAASLTPPLASMDTNFHSKFDATLETNDLAISSPETISHQSAPLADDKAPEAPQELPLQTPPTPAAEDDTDINMSSFEYPHPMVYPEAMETVVSPDPRRLSFISDTSLASPEVSEFSSCSRCSSMAAHSTEPSIVIYSPVGYTISPSPEFERRAFTSEPETISSTPEIIHRETDYSVTPTDFQGSVSSVDSKLCLTPESRSITSTPEIRQEFLTPDSMPTASSPELMSATPPRTLSSSSPEVKTMACSILSPKPTSPQIQGITYRVVSPQNQVLVLPQYSDVQEMRFTESPTSVTHPATDIPNRARDSPSTSKCQNASPTPENMSRASSTTLSLSRDATSSPEIRDQQSPDRFSDHISVPDVCTSLEPIIEQVDLPSLVSDERCLYSVQEEPYKSCSPALDECKDFASEDTEDILASKASEELLSTEPPDQKIKDPEAVPSGGELPVMQVQNVEDSKEKIESESLSDLITHKNINSTNAKSALTTILTATIAEEMNFLEGNDSSNERGEMLIRGSGGSGKPPVHVPARPRESPNVFHCGNDRAYDRHSCRNKGWSKERVVQGERTSAKGEENIAEGSYREEQVELSFRDRNRKGSASHSAAPSSGDPKSGIPARCYFESPLTTRQQQSLLRAQGLQKENKSSARRVQSGFQSKHRSAGCTPSGCTAETSSMGSEFDEADNEVKWFTDVAFTSLSSPQGDYLDVYSSSHRSSTNVSQPSTVDSPGTATWMSYADLRASAVHENDDLQSHTPPFLPHGTLDPSQHFEISSFECVDVAVESKEESKRGSKRTVPKRQIQLKRRNNEESMSTENTGNVLDSPFLQRRSRDAPIRQNSTPAAGHKDMSHLSEGETEIQDEKKMLQKSASFDETSTKTKMATTIIKSVLSKKMETKEPSRSEESSPSEDKKKHPEPLSVESGESGNIERHIESLSSSLPSECSLSSEDYSGREGRSPYLQKKKSCAPKVPPKPIFKPNFIPASWNSGIVALQDRMPGADQMRPRMVDPCQSRTPPKKQIVLNSDKEAETSLLGERSSHDSANTTARNTALAATRAASTHNRFANRDSEYCATPEPHKQHDCKRMFLSKTSEITLKPCTTKDKNKSSQKISFSPAHSIDESQLEETPEWQTKLKPDRHVQVENEEDEKLNSKPVIHKVRDVRKLVKNTYNLSFKASNTTLPVEGPVEVPQKEKEMQNPHALHIECKAISRKDKQASDYKGYSLKDETPHPDKSGMEVTTEMNSEKNTIDIKAKTSLTKVTMESKQKVKTVQVSDVDTIVTSNQCTTKSKPPENTVHSSDLEVPPRPTSKETSTLLFLQDDTSSANSCLQKPGSPAPTHGKSMSSSHSVSMILKEKGMQADIGVCEVLNEGIGATPKHINRLEVPLQTCVLEGASNESQKDKEVDEPCEPKQSVDTTLQGTQCFSLVRSSPKPRELRVSPSGKLTEHTGNQGHTASMQPSREAEKMTTPSKISPPLTSNKAEVRSFASNSTNKSNAMPVTASKEIELPIQVRSVSSDRPKPVPPKPSYKQPFTEMRSTSSDLPKTDIPSMPSIFKQQPHLKTDVKKSETPSVAVAQKEQSTEAASNSIKKLAVSAVSSYKPSIPATGSNSDSEQKPTGPSVATIARQQVSITSVQNSVSNTRHQLDMTTSEDQAVQVSASSCASSHPVLPVSSQSHTYIQPSKTASSITSYQLLKDDFHFHESDDPPSYDERESFSPLLLSDLPPKRLNRYHPSNKPSPCSCTTSSHPHPSNPYPGPQNCTPPASRASPGQVISYPSAPPKAQVRPHQAMNYPSVSPKTSIPPAPAMIQPLNHSYPCPAPAVQSYSDEQPPSSNQMQMERNPANRRSPQAGSGAAFREHSRSPNMAMDPRSQFFGPHDLPPAFSHDYGSDGPGGSSVLYPENASGLGYGQGPRRVLLDPETGKYFYIEVPVQPLRKMLFDPEIGQYVEVLIPQQAMSHSGMYPPTAAPYPSLHGPGLYTPQYLPYGAPPHPQSAQQPRHPDTSVSTSLHQTSMGYGGSAGQTPKSEAKSHSSLDQSYLENMYYISTGINASPNSTPSDCYHKPSPNMPASSGRRV